MADNQEINLNMTGNTFGVKLETAGTYMDRNIVFNINEIVSGDDAPTVNLMTNKTVTPTTSQQVVNPDSGYDGFQKFTVNAIPSSYIVPSGNYNITSNGTNINIAQYATVSVAVPSSGGSSVNLQTSKTVTPTASQQTVTPDSGYGGLQSVIVNAIPNTYTANTKIQSSKTVTPTTSQQTINPDTNYSAMSKVVVNAIPSNYIVPSGNYAISENGSDINVAQYATVSVNVPSGGSSSTGTATATGTNNSASITFSNLSGQPKTWSIEASANITASTTKRILAAMGDGTNSMGSNIVSGTSWYTQTTTVASFSGGITTAYNNKSFTITIPNTSTNGTFNASAYTLYYTY